MGIGKRIVNLREARGWSQRELAKRVKLNPSVMNRIESEDRPLKDQEILSFASVFGVSTDYLLGNTVKDKNIKMIAGKEVDLSRFDERQLMLLEWGWERIGLSSIESTEDLEQELEDLAVYYDFFKKQREKRESKKD